MRRGSVRRRSLLLATALLTALPLRAHAATPKVVATFSVLGDMVKRIGGNRVSLTVIVGPDGDCETYEPTAADAGALADADLLVMNGLNHEFEPWLDNLLQQAQFHGQRLVASDGVHALKRAEEENRPAEPALRSSTSTPGTMRRMPQSIPLTLLQP